MDLQIIQKKIYEIRGQKVMLDFDLAELYDVETRALNQAVKRNSDIFPDDFMFKLTGKEWENMSSQIVMTSLNKRPKTAPPLAFTEHGVTMLANVLKSKSARRISVTIVRVFIALKQFVISHKELAEQISNLEKKYNRQFADINQVLKFLMDEKQNHNNWKKRKRIGYK